MVFSWGKGCVSEPENGCPNQTHMLQLKYFRQTVQFNIKSVSFIKRRHLGQASSWFNLAESEKYIIYIRT